MTTLIDIQPFIIALNDDDQYMRLRAAEILGQLGDPAAVPVLMQAIYDPDNTVKYGKGIFARKSVQNVATDALVAIGGPTVVEALQQMLADEDKSWRLMAILLLKQVAYEHDQKHTVLGILQQLLTEPDLEIRTTAIEALREIIFEGDD